jgi:hypothetical protein
VYAEEFDEFDKITKPRFLTIYDQCQRVLSHMPIDAVQGLCNISCVTTEKVKLPPLTPAGDEHRRAPGFD